jgi:hypothetical protein
MAKKAVITAESVEVDEVDESNVGAAEEKGLSNGLGLEALFPTIQKPKKVTKVLDTENTGALDADEAADEDAPTAEKKETPAKDPKTGRFLKKAAAKDTPPIEDAADDDDSDALKKRLKDTRDWATQVNQKAQASDLLVKKLQSDIAILTKKVEGTYVEPAQPEVDPVQMARLEERAKISRAVAEQIYGPELVQELVYAEDAPYRVLEQADPFVRAKVFGADQPVMEAIRQLKWKHFFDQYGTDPDDAYGKVRDEIKAEFVKTLKEKGRGKKTVDDLDGLSNMNGAGGSERTSEHSKVAPTSLAKLFPGFPTGHF